MAEFAPETLDVTIAVCTRNRKGPITELLESVTRLEVPPGVTWEMLVVDNDSTDGAREAILSFQDRLPLHYGHEKTPGVANARNKAVSLVRGKYIFWTDDDAELDPQWMVAYWEAFKRHPEAAILGGEVIPVLRPPTPKWFAKLSHLWPVSDLVAYRNFGDQEIPLDFTRDLVPWGVNHAIRTADQRRFRYDPHLGVSPVMRRSGEESEMMFELMYSGVPGWWIPSAKVRHLYPPARQTRKYFFKHYAAIGETLAYLEQVKDVHYMNIDGKQKTMADGPAAWLRIKGVFNAVLFAGFHVIGLTRRSLYHLRRLAMYFGAASYKEANPKPPAPL